MKKLAKLPIIFGVLMMAFLLASCGNDTGTATVAEPKTTLDAVGDIYLSDGTVIAAADASSMTDEQKAKAEAVVFYVGGADSVLGNRTLAVNVKSSNSDSPASCAWAPENTTGYNTDFNDLKCKWMATQPESGAYYEYTSKSETYYLMGDFDGSDNWEKIKETDPTGAADAATNYPAYNYVNTVLGEHYYLPTCVELEELYKNFTTVYASIRAVGGSYFGGIYWSSSQSDYASVWARYVSLSDGSVSAFNKSANMCVCGIRAFSN